MTQDLLISTLEELNEISSIFKLSGKKIEWIYDVQKDVYYIVGWIKGNQLEAKRFVVTSSLGEEVRKLHLL